MAKILFSNCGWYTKEPKKFQAPTQILIKNLKFYFIDYRASVVL